MSKPNSSQTPQDIASAGLALVQDISNLQILETDLSHQLQANISSNNPNASFQQDLIDEINTITNQRIRLYKSLEQIGGFYVHNLGDTSMSLENQMLALEIVENELNETKLRLSYIEDQKISKLRLVEIKKYYGERYDEHTSIMKYICFMFVWIFILSWFANRGIIPDNVYFLLLLIVGVIYGVLIIRAVSRIMKRDRMNYEEYDWGNPSSYPTAVASLSYQPFDMGLGEICMGQSCCGPHETYSVLSNVCEPDPGYCGNKSKTTPTPTTDPNKLYTSSISYNLY